jgi:signal transduction histidine kinase
MIIRSEYDRQAVRVTVMDRGGGFSAEVRYSCSGMDMALSTSIIDAHRGRIWAESNKSYGATVQFTPPSRQTVGPW